MAYMPGWNSIGELVQRLDDLGRKVSGGKVIPAPWEPFQEVCPSFRDARAYDWALRRLQSPVCFAADLAFFPQEQKEDAPPIPRANWLMLCAEGEHSVVTGKMMLLEALDLWDEHGEKWLEQIVVVSARLRMEISLDTLRQAVQETLRILKQADPAVDTRLVSDAEFSSTPSHAFDRELLHMDGWTQDPGTIYLPTDGKLHLLAKEVLILNLQQVVLLRGRRVARVVDWEKVTVVYLLNGDLVFDVSEEPPLVVSGIKCPENALATIQEFYRAATERRLQALAAQVTRPWP
jgi:hypothetical protein